MLQCTLLTVVRVLLQITVVFITGLIALIREHVVTMEAGDTRTQAEAHFRNTLQHIEVMQAKPDGAMYKGVVLK